MVEIIIKLPDEAYNTICSLEENTIYDRFEPYIAKAIKDSKSLPKGRWINNHTQCSNCEWGMEDDVVGSPMMLFFPFCPNCGARMVKTYESEE